MAISRHEQIKRLQALAAQGNTLVPALDKATREGDTERRQAIVHDLIAILSEMAGIRVELGEEGELLQFLLQVADRTGIDLSSVLPRGRQ